MCSFGLKMQQNPFLAGLHPGPRWGSLRRSPGHPSRLGRGTPSVPIPLSLDAFGVSALTPSLQNPDYANVPTSSDFGEQHQVQTGSRNSTGSTNNLATETHIDTISMTTPMFSVWGRGSFFTGVYANLTRRFVHSEIPRRWADAAGSYNFVMENDIKMISTAAAMLCVCTATVSVANLLLLPVCGTVYTSGSHLVLLSKVGQ